MGNLIKETPYSEVTATLEVLDRLGVNRDCLARIRKNEELAKKLADLIIGKSAESAGNIFRVVVDYSKPLKDMIAAGIYDRVHSDITEKHFQLPKPPAGLPTKAKLNLELVNFNKYITSEDAIAEFKKRGFRPATLPELLAFGATYPDKQREFPIAALGSFWQSWLGYRHVPYLWGGSGGRDLHLSLDLDFFEHRWGEDYRFLGVRESFDGAQDKS